MRCHAVNQKNAFGGGASNARALRLSVHGFLYGDRPHPYYDRCYFLLQALLGLLGPCVDLIASFAFGLHELTSDVERKRAMSPTCERPRWPEAALMPH